MSDEHEAFVKTPKQLITVVVLSFVVPILIIALLVNFVTTGKRTGTGADTMSPASIDARIKPVAHFELRDANAPRTLKSGEEVFKGQCTTCHTAGLAGAPKVGDAAAWAARIKTGYEALLNSALKGKGAMAPQGGGEYEDTEVGRAVVYMANAAGAKFPDPGAASGAAAAATPAAAAGAAAASPAASAAPAAGAAAAAPAASAAPAAPAAAGSAVAGPVKLYFDTGKADLAADAGAQLAAVIDAVKGGKATKVVISGFHDKTGNADQNAELAKQRAVAIAKVLTQSGLTDAQIDLRKPQETTGGKDDREARRVEVSAEKS